jgi:hypothetical protein
LSAKLLPGLGGAVQDDMWHTTMPVHLHRRAGNRAKDRSPAKGRSLKRTLTAKDDSLQTETPVTEKASWDGAFSSRSPSDNIFLVPR